MKSTLWIFFIVIVALGSYLLLGSSIPDQNVAVYSSDRYGISFEYPKTYVIDEREVGDSHRSHYSITLFEQKALENMPQNGEGPTAITIDIFQNDLDALSIDQWVRGTSYSNFKLSQDGLIATTSLARVPALSYTWDGLYRGESVVFAHAGAIVMLSVTSLTPQDNIRADFTKLLDSISLY